MKTTTFNEAKENLNNLGFVQISGDEIFATFQNIIAEFAYVFVDGINPEDGFTTEIN